MQNAKKDESGRLIPGQIIRHPDGKTIMTTSSPNDGMRIFDICTGCYRACKPRNRERHSCAGAFFLVGASKAINDNINSNNVIIEPSPPPVPSLVNLS